MTSNNEAAVFAFTREEESDKILPVFNLTGNNQVIELKNESLTGQYNQILKQAYLVVSPDQQLKMTLMPWE